MSRVARWFVFKHEVPFWVNFGGPLIGKCWYTYFVSIGNIWQMLGKILWSFGTFCVHWVNYFRFWYHVQRKNLAAQAMSVRWAFGGFFSGSLLLPSLAVENARFSWHYRRGPIL
jgi:hypothetical protein